jgi:DNA polymerase III alpha subunit (gram-positive type)
MECPDILKNMSFVVFDLETNGLNPLFSTIIEIGCIEVERGIITNQYTTLFGGGKSSMYLVRRVHKIKDSERVGKKSFKERAGAISRYFSNKILVGHNIDKYDIPMMQTKLSECGYNLENIKSIDTLKIAREIGHDSNTLENLSKFYNVEEGEHHRGFDDAKMTLNILYVFAEKFPDKLKKYLN